MSTKKENKTKVLCVMLFAIALFGINNLSFSQEWLLGANPRFGPDGVGPGNNIFGTNFSPFPNPGQSIRIRTNGTFRMFTADGGTGATEGFIAIGNGFLSPRSRVHLHQPATIANGEAIYMQITNGTTGTTPVLLTASASASTEAVR